MMFTAPDWALAIYSEASVPDDIPLIDFMLDEKYGRCSLSKSHEPFVCGLSGRTFTATEQSDRTQNLARMFARELNWKDFSSEFDKTMAVFTYNTIDAMTVHWAIHRLNGIVCPVSATCSRKELVYQLKDSGSRALVTCRPLLSIALPAAEEVGIPRDHIFVCDLPEQMTGNSAKPSDLHTIEELIQMGAYAPQVPSLQWSRGQAGWQTAYICYSSGTSGLPKGVRISHYNVMANVRQLSTFEQPERRSRQDCRDIVLGLMPQSHIYALIIMCHAAPYRGDKVIVLPKYNLRWVLQSIQTYAIHTLFLVPAVIVDLVRSRELLATFDTTSVNKIVTGAAPMGPETAKQLTKQFPNWHLCQGYGMTETATVVSWTSQSDISLGSSGSFLPGTRCKLITEEGKEVSDYNHTGEVLISSPSLALGYHNNDSATEKSFFKDEDCRWFRTGDEAVIRRSNEGHEHIWITGRVKDLIKVKGLQVAPAELEAHLLQHPLITDCAVIGVPDERAGELPKAFVVLGGEKWRYANDHEAITQQIHAHVGAAKASHKRLKGGIEFIDAIPRNATGKILHRQLREQERRQRVSKM